MRPTVARIMAGGLRRQPGRQHHPHRLRSAVVACAILRKNDLKVTFLDFAKIGDAFALAQLVLASGSLLILQLLS